MSSKFWKLLKRTYLYNAKTEDEISVISDKLLMQSGREIDYIFVHSPYEVVYVLGYMNGNILLINQHRYVVDKEVLEIPAGSPLKGETLESGAIREFKEESGYIPEKLIKLGTFYPSVGITDQVGHIYLALNLTEGVQDLDESEIIKLNWMSFEIALNMVIEGKIENVGAAYAILLFDKWKQNNNI